MRSTSTRPGAAGEQPRPLVNEGQTRAFLASIVESSDDSIIGTDLEGTILSWNGGAERMWGYTAEEAIGKHIKILFPVASRDDYRGSLRRIQGHERIERFESVRVKKDGALLDVSVILSPIVDDLGGLCGVSAIYRDITKDKKSAAELVRAKEAAEAASRAKSEFLANMSHEIRTPMNGVLGMLEVALDLDLTPELRDYLETARASAGALLGILNDILDFSKIEAGRMVLEQIPLSIAGLVREAVSTQTFAARNKGLDLRCAIDQTLPDAVLGDPTRLRQVLVNLVNNAVKFSDHGYVEVRAKVERRYSDAATVRFSVTDTGIGMSPEQCSVIFEEFRQADGSTTRQYGGTGLGLSICQRLVNLMGGTLRVTSELGHGSTFEFSIRLKTP